MGQPVRAVGKHGHDWEFRFPAAPRRGKLPAGRVADRLALAGRDRTAPTLAVLALPGGPRHDAPLIPRLAGAFLDRGGIVRDAEAAGLLGGCSAPARQRRLDGAAGLGSFRGCPGARGAG
jgi:hypothetical protein